MTRDLVYAAPFRDQEILRNIAIGFGPYLPFTQRYRLEMNSDFAGRGTGYLSYGPQDLDDNVNPANTDTARYGWKVRRDVYRGLGEKKLQYMSQYYGAGGRWRLAKGAAPQMSAGLAAKAAMKYIDALDKEIGGIRGVKELPGGPVPSRVIDEIGIANLTRMLDEELQKAGKAPQDIHQKKIERDLIRGAGYSSQGFDLHLEDHRVLSQFLKDKLLNFDETVYSAEITRARNSNRADKAMTTIKTKPPAGSETAALSSKMTGVATRLNKIIEDFVKIMTPEQRKKYDEAFVKRGEFGALRTVIAQATRKPDLNSTASNLPRVAMTQIAKDYEWSTLKQFLDRGRRNQTIASQLKLNKDAISHVYQSTIQGGFIGLTIMRQTRKKLFAGTERAMSIPVFLPPKVGDVVSIEVGKNGTLSSAISHHFSSEQYLNDAMLTKNLEFQAYEFALGQSVLGAGREELIMEEFEAGLEYNIEDQVSQIVVGGVNASVKLVPTEIAKNLHDQIINNLDDAMLPVTQLFDSLIRESNNLSKAWYDSVPSGKKAKMSTEFQFGDGMGNPAKKYLGVWNEGGIGAWKGNIGQNISMAPFIVARRQKVANVRDGGFQPDR